MIDRFNFYDIYGYLLPGVLLFSFLWIPLGVLTGTWPPAELSSAVLVLALAYVVGHILHSLADAALPFEFKDKDKKKRMPSDLLLDANNQVLVNAFSDVPGLLKQIREDFELKEDFKLEVEENGKWTPDLGKRRSYVFFRCRNVLVRQKSAGYAEQQQGMYVVMRGAASALLLSCMLYAGMGIGLLTFRSQPDLRCVYLALILLFLLMIAAAIFSIRLQSTQFSGSKEKEKRTRRWLFWLVAGAFFFSGLAISRPVGVFVTTTTVLPPLFNQVAPTDPVKPDERERTFEDPAKYRERERALEELQLTRQIRSHATGIVFAWTAISALLALICVAAYRNFAVNYALQIYRDYLNVHFPEAGPTKNSDQV